ncbi:hypothetical protein PP175_26765 (plasmid) [Aneurinibacillus sp. Ricciae_BoGa-3]|uniref:hypothetical protein n=1 Tax=Aneurinibacillus sp. Ricciae_BoGa-3 TaxID=3022697 RepID=UPI0023415766|nr:hypothetical protein [Aneurinibacillus sp. Ricciae_BoGa-3]WCK57641.1 hypothetical protein PP175_26765 [Aneurinibacillus sp. Ricciae_BoGa-3]
MQLVKIISGGIELVEGIVLYNNGKALTVLSTKGNHQVIPLHVTHHIVVVRNLTIKEEIEVSSILSTHIKIEKTKAQLLFEMFQFHSSINPNKITELKKELNQEIRFAFEQERYVIQLIKDGHPQPARNRLNLADIEGELTEVGHQSLQFLIDTQALFLDEKGDFHFGVDFVELSEAEPTKDELIGILEEIVPLFHEEPDNSLVSKELEVLLSVMKNKLDELLVLYQTYVGNHNPHLVDIMQQQFREIKALFHHMMIRLQQASVIGE